MATLTRCASCGTVSDGRFCDNCGGDLAAPSKKTVIDLGAPRSITIGRDSSCSYQISKPTISSQHALLEYLPGGHLQVRDLGSKNGVGINSPLNRIGEEFEEIAIGDKLFLGRTEVLVRDILIKTAHTAHATQGKAEAITLKMRGNSMVLGRDSSADYPLPHPMVSSRHARLSREGNRYFIEDLSSTNGTFVHGKRLAPNTRTPIKVGDEIGLGSYTFTFNETGDIVVARTGNEISVTAENLAVHIKKNGETLELLGDVSLTIEPNDMVALMGPSGAGKTTFLTALNGITPPDGGRVLYRNLDLAENFDRFRTMIGYVPQDDIVHPQLTVYKALYYTAKLRLPSDYTEQQIDERIWKVLNDVGLGEKKLANEVIGDAAKKTLSGGQRKRVNLAMELLSEPWVLFLDEPTSGLSSVDALMVIELLKKMADNNRTIIVTIHQPSLEVYQNFKLLAMISNHPNEPMGPRVPGRLVYFGPAMDAFQFFSAEQTGPEKIEAQLKKRPVSEWQKKYNDSSYKKTYVGDRKKTLAKAPVTTLPSARKQRFLQLGVLCRRLSELKIRDKTEMAIALLLPAIFGVLVALSQKIKVPPPSTWIDYDQFITFAQNFSTAHFLMVVAAVWFGCNNSIREIVSERAIYRRERLVNLSLLSYFSSKYVVLGLLGLLQCLFMLSIVYFSLGLRGDFLKILLVLWLTTLIGTGMGLCISSVTRSNEQAIASLPLALLPMIVLGGCLTTLSSLRSTPPLGWFSNLAPTRWGFEGNLVLENDDQGTSARIDSSRVVNSTSFNALKEQSETQLRQVTAQAQACQNSLVQAQRQQAAMLGKIHQTEMQAKEALGPDYQQKMAANGVDTRVLLQQEASMPHSVKHISTAPSMNSGVESGVPPVAAFPPAATGGASGYMDMADRFFPHTPLTGDKNWLPRHTWFQDVQMLFAMTGFWALATLIMLKKDEWEWWKNLF